MRTRNFGGDLMNVAVHTATTVPINPESNVNIFTNRGATAQVTFQLPPAEVGMGPLYFFVQAAQVLAIDPNGTETISLAGVAQSAGSYIGADAVGEMCAIVCVEKGKWVDIAQRGTWTAV